MNSGSFVDIAVDQIRVPEDRARAFDADGAAALAGLIEVQGLMHPITVRQHFASTEEKPLYLLVAGLHRLRAFEQLGRSVIPARVVAEQSNDEARLDEVLENLGRNELTALDRAQHLYELKVVYERMHPEAAHGKASPKSQTLALSSKRPEVFGFAKATAEKIGLSQSAIKAAVKIWTGLTPDSRRRLRGVFTIADVVCDAEDGERDAVNDVGRYIRILKSAGYVSELPGRRKGTRPGSNGLKRFRLDRNTGPRAPLHRSKLGIVHDFNTGEDFPCR